MVFILYWQLLSKNMKKYFISFALLAAFASFGAGEVHAISALPSITLLGNTDVTVNVGDTYTDAGATAVDVFNNDITPNIVTTGLPIDTSVAGDYTITYNVTDAHDEDNILHANPVTRTVHVVQPALVTIRVHKVTNPENVDKDFTFTVRQGTSGEGTIVATSTANAKEGGNDAVFSNLPAGDYTVTEDVPEYWTLSNVSCVYDESEGSQISNGEAVYLHDNGDEADCTFTNTATRGSIKVVKVVLPADSDIPVTTDTHTFGVILAQGDSQFAPHSISVGNDVLFEGLYPGIEYTLRETADSDYTTVSILPDQNSDTSGAQITPEAGVTTVVTITNRQNVSMTTTPTDNTSTTTDTVIPRPGGNRRSGGQVLGAEIGPGDESGGSCTPYLTSFIKFGANNDSEQVKKLQTFLNGYENANLTVNGVYDQATFDAVEKFQSAESLYVLKPWIDAGFPDTVATGYVYKTTLWRINSLNCAGVTLPMPKLP